MNLLNYLSAKIIVCAEQEDGAIYPMDQGGMFPLKDEWESTKRKIDLFYELNPDSEIEEHNYKVLNHLYPVGVRGSKPARRKLSAGYVYLLHHNGLYKIGRTRRLTDRILKISPLMPHEVTLIHSIESDDCVGLERLLHEKYADKRMNGEWFALSDDDVQDIKNGDYEND